MPVYETVKGWGIGGLLAVLVLVGCFVLYIIGKPVDNNVMLLMLAMLALARLT
jgi:hypothetical protein